MSHDSNLGGCCDGVRAGCERLFFALLPPQQSALRTSAASEERLGVGWQIQRAARLHVTLGITDDFDRTPSRLLERLLLAGDAVDVEPFILTLDRLTIGERSASLRPASGNRALRRLARAIADAMRAAGVPMRDGWQFRPHMTLAYRTAGRAGQHAVSPLTWEAADFVLIRSLVGRTRHILLRRWPLRPAPVSQYELF